MSVTGRAADRFTGRCRVCGVELPETGFHTCSITGNLPVGDYANQRTDVHIASLERELAAARHDLLVYRGALGYPVPGGTDDCLSDGTRPVNGLAEAMGWHHEENQRLQGDLVSLRVEVGRAMKWGYQDGLNAMDHYGPWDTEDAAWLRYQREQEGGEK